MLFNCIPLMAMIKLPMAVTIVAIITISTISPMAIWVINIQLNPVKKRKKNGWVVLDSYQSNLPFRHFQYFCDFISFTQFLLRVHGQQWTLHYTCWNYFQIHTFFLKVEPNMISGKGGGGVSLYLVFLTRGEGGNQIADVGWLGGRVGPFELTSYVNSPQLDVLRWTASKLTHIVWLLFDKKTNKCYSYIKTTIGHRQRQVKK